MPIPNTPEFVYGAVPVTLSLQVPVRPWSHGVRARGADAEESAAGVPSVYVHRWEYPTRFVIRFPESQWPDVRAMLQHGMEGGTITYHPQGVAGGTSFVCYLVSPTVQEEVEPGPDAELRGWLELPIRLRRTTAAAITGEYFDG